MEQNLISAVITTEDVALINGAIETIKQKLPFLSPLPRSRKKESTNLVTRLNRL